MENVSDLSGAQEIPIIQQVIQNFFLNFFIESKRGESQLRETLLLTRFKAMGDLINDTIDWEVSDNERRVTVRQHIDEELDEWKRMYHGLDSLLVSFDL